MSTEGEGAPTAATETSHESAPATVSAAARAFVARKEAAGAEGKAGTGDASTAGTSRAPAADAGKPSKPADASAADDKGKDAKGKERTIRVDPNVLKKDREADKKLSEAKAIAAELAPLKEAISNRQYRKVLELLAQQHGAKFADFVDVLTSDKDETTETPAETAARVAREELEKAEAKKAADAEKKAKDDAEAEAKKVADGIRDWKRKAQKAADADPKYALASDDPVMRADDGTVMEGEDGAPVRAMDYAWRLVEASWELDVKEGRTPTAMPIKRALEMVETKLRGQRDARAKQSGARNPADGGNRRDEASGHRVNGGRAVEPSLNNRSASGAPAVIPRDPSAPVTWGSAAVRDAATRAGIKLS